MEEEGVRTVFETLTEIRTPHLVSLIQDTVTSLLSILTTTLLKLAVVGGAKLLFFSSLRLLSSSPGHQYGGDLSQVDKQTNKQTNKQTKYCMAWF